MIFKGFVYLIIICIMAGVNGMENPEMRRVIKEKESIKEYEPLEAKDRRTLRGTLEELALDEMHYVENGEIPIETVSFCTQLSIFFGSLKSREYSNWEFVFKEINEGCLDCFFDDPHSSFYVLHQAIADFTEYKIDDVIRFCEEDKMQPNDVRAICKFLKTFWLAMIHLPILSVESLIFSDYTQCEIEPVVKGLKEIYDMKINSADELLLMLKKYKDILYNAGKIIGKMDDEYFLDNKTLRYLR